MGQDRRVRRGKFGTARPCRVATLGKGREASGARPQPETARERTQTYVTEPDTARTKRRAAYRPAPLHLHGTGGTGHQFLNPNFAGPLFGPGEPLDISRYYIILPDNIGHGKSSKPSDGLHAHFPHYGYHD